MLENNQINEMKKEISTLQWDIPFIHNMDLKLIKEKKLIDLKERLKVL